MKPEALRGLWRLADPKISLTSVAGITVGAAAVLAGADRSIAWDWLLVTFAAYFCMEVAKNAWGEVVDWESGVDAAVDPADRTSFSGGKRVLVDSLLTQAGTRSIAALFTLLGLGLGAVIVFWREPAAFWIGAIGFVLGWSYHGPPLKLAYRGLGELDVVLCYGPLIVLSTELIQVHAMSLRALWLSLPLGLLIAAFLIVNEFPDYRADAAHGKRNLVVRLGRERAVWLLSAVYAAAFALIACLPVLGLPKGAWLGGIALVPAAAAAALVAQAPRTFHRHRPAQPLALLAFLVYAGGVASGIALDGNAG
jgi:1,4-dihydroxy-2-naphthoate octaprenyltransferase